MRHKTVMFVIAVLSVFLFSQIAEADFSVDSRSFLHVGAAAGISMTVNTFAVEAKIPQRNRNIIAFTTAFGAGAFKEFIMDDSADMGDLFFNGLGAIGGIYLSEKYFITPMEHGVIVGVRW